MIGTKSSRLESRKYCFWTSLLTVSSKERHTYLHVINVEVLLDNGCGLLLQLIFCQGRFGSVLGGRGRGSCLLLHYKMLCYVMLITNDSQQV